MGQDLNCTNPFYDYEQDDDGGNATSEADDEGGEGTEVAAAAPTAGGDGDDGAAASAQHKPPDPEQTKAGRVYKYDAARYERDKLASKEKLDSEGNRFITDQHL